MCIQVMSSYTTLSICVCVCFVLQALPVAELPPFRLTRQLRNVLLPHDAAGLLQPAMAAWLDAALEGQQVTQQTSHSAKPTTTTASWCDVQWSCCGVSLHSYWTTATLQLWPLQRGR